MPDQANVNSFDAIESVRAVLLQFAKMSDDGLTELKVEMRRFIDWLEHDRPGFWKEQVRLSHDAVHQSKLDLQRCLMYPVGVNDRPSCSEERAALKKAEAYHAHCLEKQERLRHWVREVRHELLTYEGRTARLQEAIEVDVPKAAATLGQILNTLEKYAGIATPGGDSAGTIGAPADEQAGEGAAGASPKPDSGAAPAEGGAP